MTWLRGKNTCLALMLTVLTLKLGKHYFSILFRFFSFCFLFLSWTLQLYIILTYEKDLPLANKVYVCKTIFIKFKHKLVFNVLNFLLLWVSIPTYPHIHMWDSMNLEKSCFHVNLKFTKAYHLFQWWCLHSSKLIQRCKIMDQRFKVFIFVSPVIRCC